VIFTLLFIQSTGLKVFCTFFKGIFLESHLHTSSRMLEFIFKMLSEGHAAVPELGMGEIPKMLRQLLGKNQIYFNTAGKIKNSCEGC